MKKVVRIGFKDLRIVLRDRSALIMMLLAPLLLTVAMGFVSGSFSENDSSGPEQIAVVVANHDQGLLGRLLLEALRDQGDLLDVRILNKEALARGRVDDDAAAAAVIIPSGYSAGFQAGSSAGDTAQIELYANPGRPISAGIVEAIVSGFSKQIEAALVADQVTVQVVGSQMTAASMPAGGGQPGLPASTLFTGVDLASPITIQRRQTAAGEEQRFDPLAYFAAGMAVFFLMYTVSIGGRSILAERDAGTLTRMLSSPTTTAQVLGGKVLGVFLTGLVQVSILIVASGLLFGLHWGSPAGVAALVIAVVAAATGWGILLAASSKNAGQVSGLGTALMLIFGMLGGTFISTSAYGTLMTWLSRLTPNRWALDGFAELAQGGLSDIYVPVLVLLAMATALFTLSVFVFRRRWVSIA